jgi:uncharacterized membrane protein YgdD (TMEM256/DUF423 family)
MNRKLLFLGVFLSIIGVFASGMILLLKGASSDATQNLAFVIAVQLNFFHATILFVLAWMKRKYADQNLVSVGWVFTLSILVFSGTSYLSMLFESGTFLFNTVGVAGIIGLISGWIFLSKEFYNTFVPKHR